ncbi:MAG: right-handed parallel beta-helix repeat-containing protein, partial [Ignavibacteria bacterium]
MKNFNNFLLILFANLIFLSSAQSETYYVNSATGNNSNSSIQAKNIVTPWLTVQYAIDNAAVMNGDNIVVAEGTYAGFTLTKRINIIGAWKGGTAAVNTIFNSSVNLSAPGGSPTERMFLKNLRVTATSGDAISMNKGYVTLENVGASTTGVNGIRINDFFIKDVLIESCNINNNNYAGIFIPTFSDIDGFVMRNSTVSNNGYFGIVAFQRRVAPAEVKNVEISHCAFVDNNPSNQIQGHTIYFEKLKNAIFKNITVAMPLTNERIGIDINLLSRTDYSNITIENSRITRQTPGSGIWIQARNDLLDPPAALDTVVLRGLTFNLCDTNIAFNRQVKRMTVDKCDLSTYSVYGLVNYTDQDGIIEAANNKWQGGGIPDTTVISGGLLVTGSPIISFMPSTDGIFLGMCIQGPGITPGATVIGKSPNTII